MLRQRLLGSPALAEQLERKIGDTTYATLAAAFEQATPEIGAAIKAALRALVPPLMEDAVLRTAIAIAVEYAASTCAQQLLELVPRKVGRHSALPIISLLLVDTMLSVNSVPRGPDCPLPGVHYLGAAARRTGVSTDGNQGG